MQREVGEAGEQAQLTGDHATQVVEVHITAMTNPNPSEQEQSQQQEESKFIIMTMTIRRELTG